ncbi:hypothetical protein AB2I14_23470, partial (plasmid) [Escherichia coli]
RGENAAQIDNLSDIKVKIKNEGILPSFSKYIDGTSHEGVYNIKNLFLDCHIFIVHIALLMM